MSYVLSTVKVKDFATWKTVFSSPPAVAARAALGRKSERIFRSEEDPSLVLILLEWDTLANAHQFFSSEQLHRSQAEAGVIGTPTVHFLTEA